MDWTARQLKKGNKITVGSYGNMVKDRVESGDRLTLIPLSATVKENDLVYCDVNGWVRVRVLKEMKDGKFFVENLGRKVIIPFEDIYGQVLEIRKKQYVDERYVEMLF